jgi:hypothetical protein
MFCAMPRLDSQSIDVVVIDGKTVGGQAGFWRASMLPAERKTHQNAKLSRDRREAPWDFFHHRVLIKREVVTGQVVFP